MTANMYFASYAISCCIFLQIAAFLTLDNLTLASDDLNPKATAAPPKLQIHIEGSLQVKPTATRGMMIDAGSGGSRLHVYRWAPRIFNTIPPPISYPTSDEKWTGKMSPGVATFINNLDGIKDHLAPLIAFAKSVLDIGDDYSEFPLFFKATGGVRELNAGQRELILNKVRELLSDKSFSPFYFRNDFARVISGEEEAIYSWAGANFLLGTLLPQSQGTGAVSAPNKTYSTLDLGGSSTQIAFFQPDQDIMEGLFKLQIGGQKHWNVYAKSFLQFGINSARIRFLDSIVTNYYADTSTKKLKFSDSSVSYCFHSGYNERVRYSLDNSKFVDISGPNIAAKDQLMRCIQEITPLLFREKASKLSQGGGGASSSSSSSSSKKKGIFSSSSSYCEQVYHGECSMGGAYQPDINLNQEFIGTSSYTYPWKFLMLPQTASLEDLKNKASAICKMSFSQIQDYYESNNLNLVKDKLSDYMPYYCFISSYILVLLTDGYGFNLTSRLTVVDELNGNKVGWALGAIMYEINALPYAYKADVDEGISIKTCIFSFSLVIIGAVVGFFYSNYTYNRTHNHVLKQPHSPRTKSTNDLFISADSSSSSSSSSSNERSSFLNVRNASLSEKGSRIMEDSLQDTMQTSITPPRDKAHSKIDQTGNYQYGSIKSNSDNEDV